MGARSHVPLANTGTARATKLTKELMVCNGNIWDVTQGKREREELDHLDCVPLGYDLEAHRSIL
jgi:hypothetical protein